MPVDTHIETASTPKRKSSLSEEVLDTLIKRDKDTLSEAVKKSRPYPNTTSQNQTTAPTSSKENNPTNQEPKQKWRKANNASEAIEQGRKSITSR